MACGLEKSAIKNFFMWANYLTAKTICGKIML
nr:MAG TPA: hypothetical protein [Caudoviricetes sp.]